ncbi:hypothetical protein BIW11_14297 [Tropilaelaps mercedesae]|uniref:Uncharacterized protein n=1 Tax=Tropilaelaps mercedesae TaxID=418985 RepID=A0A1V9WYB2_9ACAR|nr:hypothetical protein BIW11_14297 [Tropilaelaps mercedesae]
MLPLRDTRIMEVVHDGPTTSNQKADGKVHWKVNSGQLVSSRADERSQFKPNLRQVTIMTELELPPGLTHRLSAASH